MTSYVRESLIFEVGLKENLLKNIEISLELARCQVDPQQVKESGKLEKPGAIPCAALRWVPQGWVWSTAPLALERPPSAVPLLTRCSKYATIPIIRLTMVSTIIQVAIQLTGEPGTFTQGILVDVNSQSLCSKVVNLFLLIPALSICSGLARVANWCRGSLTT